MIYAIIIILALAIAFIILIRRLPGAFTPSQESRPDRKLGTAFAFKMPSFKLPKITTPKLPNLPNLPKREPTTPVITPPAPPVVTTSPKPAWKLPSFSFPKREPQPTLPPMTVEQPIESPTEPLPETKAAVDFWEQAEKPQPIRETSPVIALPPDRPKTKNVTADADSAFTARDYRKAERLYVRLAAEDPKNPKIYSRLGIIYLEQSNFEDARDAFQQAIKLEPTVATRHFNLALVYMHLGSKAKATAAMEQALKYDPSNRKYRKMLDNIMAGRV